MMTQQTSSLSHDEMVQNFLVSALRSMEICSAMGLKHVHFSVTPSPSIDEGIAELREIGFEIEGPIQNASGATMYRIMTEGIDEPDLAGTASLPRSTSATTILKESDTGGILQ